MNMNLSELINEILSEWAYRVDDGMPNPKNPTHLKELSIVLSEMGLSHIEGPLVENLLMEKGKTPEKNVVEAEGNFTNPLLNKSIKYKNDKGEDADGIVGNLLRLPKEHPGRIAAEKTLPADGTPERDALNKDLGGQGQAGGAEKPKDDKGGEAPKEDPAKAAQAMFDPKADPAMAARMDKEKDVQAQLAKDAEADKEAEKAQEPKEDGEFNPIDSKDVAKEMPEADPETFAGGSDIPDGVKPEQLEKFNTDIQKVAKQVADAKAKGEPAPNINLCDVTVPGTNLYCDDNLGIPRDEMPQFKGTAQPGSRAAGMDVDASGEVDTEPVFKEMLAQKGIKTLQTQIPADKLKATQKDLVGAKVVGMMGALEKDPNHPKITAPIYVSRDGHVIDGHHRWAAVVAYNAANPDKQIQMKTTVLDQDIKDAIPMANKFAEDMGIAAKKADANKEEPQKVTSAPKVTEKIKKKIENWTKEEKAFFEKNEGAPGSETRRSLGQALKDKAKGALKAIKAGAKHEVHIFKDATKGVSNFFAGKDVSEEEVKAIKSVGVKIATTAIFAAGMGGLAAGAAGFAKLVAIELVPHVVAETVLLGAGRAAVFADANGEAEDDANMIKFTELIAKGIEEMEITPEMMEDMVDSYNEKKESGEMDNVETPIEPKVKAEHLHLVDELMLEMIYGFIEEATAQGKEGESKKYKGYFHKGGGYYSKQSDGEITHKTVGGGMKALTAKEKAEKNKTTKPATTQSTKTVGKTIAPSGFRKTADLEPTPNTTQTATKKKGKKNKELNQTVNTKKNFNEGYFSEDGVSDDDFNNNQKVKPTSNQIELETINQFFVDKNGKTNFPKKYLKVLHRLLNTQGGTGLSISDFTDVSGAGTLPSTMGELMTLMAVTIKDENKANEFFQTIMGHVKSNGKESIIDPGWVKSAQQVRQTLFKRYDRQFGKGNWELEQMAWDTESEVEALGMQNYKENKGFSTDTYAKVKVNGKSVLDEISLKKEIKANLLNATSGRVQDIMVRGLASSEDLVIYDDLNSKIEALASLKDSKSVAEKKQLAAQRDAIIEKYNAKVPENVKVSYAQKKQRELHQDFIKNGEKEVKEFLGKFCSNDKKFRENSANVISNQLNQKGDAYKAQLTQKIDSICKEVRGGKSYAEALIGLEKADYQKLNLGIMSYIATETPKSKAAKSYKDLVDNSHAHSKAVRDFLLTDKSARKGLFASIRENLPLKSLFEGEENMILGDVSADRQVLQDVFGVETFEELEQKLTIRDTPPPPSIVYRVKGKEDIAIAEIKSRPDGIGYGGTWKLEMAVHPDFAKKLKESNQKLNK
jgi:hypothetical protein